MARIGKYVIDSLTRSMYEDSRCIFREYIQNAADQIDLARKEHLDEGDHYEIHVRIFREQRRIEIEDTATGVSRENRETLKDVATSQKKRGEHKGFRGIGRLGGLGYCTSLIFETSAKGEDIKTIMKWDAAKMNQMVDDEADDREAGSVIDECTCFEEQPEKSEKHYFKVIMENVTDDRLLDIDNVRNYLSMVSPVDYPTQFSIFSARIKAYARKNEIALDTYNLYLGNEEGEEQLFKAYTTTIKHKGEDYAIRDIEFFDKRDDDGNLIYWGWYSISEMPGQMQPCNIAYGIRLRCKNIQIGDESTCGNFFIADTEKRFSQYFYGELFIESSKLMPDARRDYLRECEYRSIFEAYVREDFEVLKRLCNEASKIRNTIKKINEAEKGQADITKKREAGFLNEKEREDSEKKWEEFVENKNKQKAALDRLKQKSQQSASPLSFMYGETPTSLPNTQKNLEKATHNIGIVCEPLGKSKLRTDDAKYNKFGKKEKEIINVVYSAIYSAMPIDTMREGLINIIERELTK